MTLEQTIIIEGKSFGVTISDEEEALSFAYAKGRAVIGLWNRGRENQSFGPADYVVEDLDNADSSFLERVVRRRYGLPWIIGETKRLLIREFTGKDIGMLPLNEALSREDRIFYEEEALNRYISCQYGFYEYGIWALVEKKSGKIIGKAGITNLEDNGEPWLAEVLKKNNTPVELGYHIFSLYQRQGYGLEACARILSYGSEQISPKVYARIEGHNLASKRLAARLGFVPITHTKSGSAQRLCLYEWSC